MCRLIDRFFQWIRWPKESNWRCITSTSNSMYNFGLNTFPLFSLESSSSRVFEVFSLLWPKFVPSNMNSMSIVDRRFFSVFLHHFEQSIVECDRFMSCSIDGQFHLRHFSSLQRWTITPSRACILSLQFFLFEWICLLNIGQWCWITSISSFSLSFRQIISLVLGDLQFNFYHRWFDCIFLLSALFSIGILYLHYRSSQQSLSLYDKNVQKVID